MPNIVESEAGEERRAKAKHNKQLSRAKHKMAAAGSTQAKKTTVGVTRMKTRKSESNDQAAKPDDSSISTSLTQQSSVSIPSFIGTSRVEPVLFEELGPYESVLLSNSTPLVSIKEALIGLRAARDREQKSIQLVSKVVAERDELFSLLIKRFTRKAKEREGEDDDTEADELEDDSVTTENLREDGDNNDDDDRDGGDNDGKGDGGDDVEGNDDGNDNDDDSSGVDSRLEEWDEKKGKEKGKAKAMEKLK